MRFDEKNCLFASALLILNVKKFTTINLPG